METKNTCKTCQYQLRLIALGQGLKCNHPENKAEGKHFKIPNSNYVCEKYIRKESK